jgi:hypothetical protein
VDCSLRNPILAAGDVRCIRGLADRESVVLRE